jgi:hypothetical protein
MGMPITGQLYTDPHILYKFNVHLSLDDFGAPNPLHLGDTFTANQG